MRIADYLRFYLLPPVVPRAASDATDNWVKKRSGQFEGYVVSGWRYSDLAIWHVKVWSMSDGEPGETYVVSAGEFFPESIAPAEKFAALRLIAYWEAAGFS